MKARDFLKELHQEKIVAAIHKAEKRTTGEIRVFISRHEPSDPIAAAQGQFTRMGMEKTADRNGVLIYVAPRVRKFAIIGDSGVHQRCGQEFWEKVAAEMTDHFKQSNFTDGIVHAIQKSGELLSQHFPAKGSHPNQLSDDVEHD
ncbi:MAG TPA: TPM domain-containing protein [Verrucomicrobiae bacterium]|nr:TPM domain-containing protein [Verrucomicrobiae bacterium]